MPKTPTFFDHFNVRDELRGVPGVEERRAIISKHVLANTRHFHKNHAEFPFDFDTPRVRELWAHVEETAEQLARGECDVGHLSGAIQAWQVMICEEYLERGRARREAKVCEAEEAHTVESSTAPEDDATNSPDIESKKESAASLKAKRGRESGEPSRRRSAQSPRKAPPAQPQSSGPQGSLFG